METARHLISPNLHVIMVHFPLGIFVFGLFLEIFGLALWRRSSARLAAKWMILLGGLLSVPAALTGIDAYEDVADHMQRPVVYAEDGQMVKDAPSADLKYYQKHAAELKQVKFVTGITANQWAMIQKHILLASIGGGLAAVGVTIALGLSGTILNRSYVYGPLLLILAGAAALMVYGSHFGGEGVYLGGLAIDMKRGAAQQGSIEWWVPARSTHILLAGLAMAAALGALGASWRLVASHLPMSEDVETDKELAALAEQANATAPPRRVTDDLTMARSLNADAAMTPPRIPSARFWLLSALLFLAALGMGVWYLVSVKQANFDLKHASASTISSEVWRTATETKQITQNRQGFHIGLGCALVVLPLILAIVVRFMYRSKWVAGTLLIVMALLIAAEIWLGVLLSFRGHEGPIYKFQGNEAAQAES